MCSIIKENNNMDSVCILVFHFILLSIEHSIVFSGAKYRTHTNRIQDRYVRHY